MPNLEGSRSQELHRAVAEGEERRNNIRIFKEGFRNVVNAVMLEAKFQLVLRAVEKGEIAMDDVIMLTNVLETMESNRYPTSLDLMRVARGLDEMVFKYNLDVNENESVRVEKAERLFMSRMWEDKQSTMQDLRERRLGMASIADKFEVKIFFDAFVRDVNLSPQEAEALKEKIFTSQEV